MRTFAQKQNQPQKPVSSNLALSHTTPGLHHRTDLILFLQRTTGNQAVQRMLQTHAEKPNAGTTRCRLVSDTILAGFPSILRPQE